MAQPQIIVYSATSVDNIPMLSDNQTFTGTNTFSGAVVLNGALSGTSVKDEDNMVSNSVTAVPTQQSTKAYADTKAPALGADDNYVTDTQKSALDSGVASGSFTTADIPPKTVTITNGVITSVV